MKRLTKATGLAVACAAASVLALGVAMSGAAPARRSAPVAKPADPGKAQEKMAPAARVKRVPAPGARPPYRPPVRSPYRPPPREPF